MARIVRSPRAKRDIIEVLAYTAERWGLDQALEYASLIEEAFRTIAGNPDRGKARDAIRPGIRSYHIGLRGRPARHVVFYRVGSANKIEVVRLLHEAMDVAGHLP